MLKRILGTAAIAAIASASAIAAPEKMTAEHLDRVVAGTEYPEPTVKGNNGWGNGPDSTNPGSFKGGTAPSKSTNSSIPGGGINEAPQLKFTGR